jgi:hypothetical protein
MIDELIVVFVFVVVVVFVIFVVVVVHDLGGLLSMRLLDMVPPERTS